MSIKTTKYELMRSAKGDLLQWGKLNFREIESVNFRSCTCMYPLTLFCLSYLLPLTTYTSLMNDDVLLENIFTYTHLRGCSIFFSLSKMCIKRSKWKLVSVRSDHFTVDKDAKVNHRQHYEWRTIHAQHSKSPPHYVLIYLLISKCHSFLSINIVHFFPIIRS